MNQKMVTDFGYSRVKAKKTKKCGHRDRDDDDFVDFCPF
jgi:hypothetical protein